MLYSAEMSDNIRVHYRPSNAVRVGLSIMAQGAPEVSIHRALDDAYPMVSFGDLLEEAYKANAPGYDPLDIAHFVMARLGKTTAQLSLLERTENGEAVRGFAATWTKAVEGSLRGDGSFSWYDVAARIITAMKENQR